MNPNGLPSIGDTLAQKYRLTRKLGQGGMGAVFEATHVELGVQVALKIVLPELAGRPEFAYRFKREARAAARLRGRHVARVLDVDTTTAGVPFLVMELLEGHSLDDELKRRGPLPIAEAVRYVREACEGVSEAHRAGVVHRDLKPANLFLSVEGAGRVIKVVDFGIAKIGDAADTGQHTATSTPLGTYKYMSPEQAKSPRSVDARTDVWSLGVVLYELLSGRTPFDGEGALGVIYAIATQAPLPLRKRRADVPEPLVAVIERALSKEREGRYQTVFELSDALAPFDGVAASPPPSLGDRSTLSSTARVLPRDATLASAPGSPLKKPGAEGTSSRGPGPRGPLATDATRERMAAPIVAPAGNDDGAFSDPATPPRLPARAALLRFAGISLVLLTPLALWLRRGPQPPPLEPQDTATRCEALIEDRPRLQGEGLAPPRPAAAPKPRVEHVAALYNQAELYRLRGQLEQAERLHQCILQLREALLGASHPDTVESVVSLGLFYYDERHDHERAEPLLRRGLEALKQTLGPSPPKLLRVLNALARIAMLKYEAAQAKGEGAQAETELQRADELTARALTIRPLGQKVATLRADALDELDTLARLYRDRGDVARADALDGRAKALREAEARPDMVPIAGGTVRLGAFDAASRPAECAALTPDDDCTEATHPERARTLEVSAFFLDASEVTNEDFAFWLDESAKGWHLGGERQGSVQTNDDPPRPLAHAGDACEGGLVVAPPTPDGPAPPEARLADDARKAELAPDATEPRSARIVVRRGYERRPVVCVTWQGASDYCRAQGKRLPTEAEWELAAKGARSRPFPWGAERPRPEGVAFGGLADALAGPRDVTTSVRDRTPEGVFDLGGNVAEWTQSGAGADRRVARGGSWARANLCHALGSSCAFRPPTTYASDLGVRCARSGGAKKIGFR